MAMENMFSKRSRRILFKNDIIKKGTDLIFTKFEASVNNSSMPAIFFLKNLESGIYNET